MTRGETWRFAVAGIVFGVLALVAALQEHWWLFGYCIVPLAITASYFYWRSRHPKSSG